MQACLWHLTACLAHRMARIPVVMIDLDCPANIRHAQVNLYPQVRKQSKRWHR